MTSSRNKTALRSRVDVLTELRNEAILRVVRAEKAAMFAAPYGTPGSGFVGVGAPGCVGCHGAGIVVAHTGISPCTCALSVPKSALQACVDSYIHVERARLGLADLNQQLHDARTALGHVERQLDEEIESRAAKTGRRVRVYRGRSVPHGVYLCTGVTGAGNRSLRRRVAWLADPRSPVGLFHVLKDVRKKIAVARRMVPYAVLSDSALWWLARRRPSTMTDMSASPLIGTAKAEYIKEPFLTVLRDHCGANGLHMDANAGSQPPLPPGANQGLSVPLHYCTALRRCLHCGDEGFSEELGWNADAGVCGVCHDHREERGELPPWRAR